MIPNQLALLRREIWEHRSLYVTPAVVALIISLMILTGYVFASGYHGAVDVGIMAGQNMLGDAERRTALMAMLIGNTLVFMIAVGILTIFYCLDSLYAERKDKSILFWRSLPVTDAETVISKLLTAAIVIPLITFGAVIVSHLINMLLASIFVTIEGGRAGLLIWQSAPLFDVWAALFIIMLALPIWFSPFIGWFLFVSAWTKRSPLLTAFLPLVVVPMLEYFILRTHFIGQAIESRFSDFPLFKGIDPKVFFDEEAFIARGDAVSLLGFVDLGKFLTSPAMWAGLVVTGLFITAAIYVRRYRDES